MAIIDFSAFRRVAFVNAIVGSSSIQVAAIAAIHATALLAIYRTEYGPFGLTLALLVWAFLNFFWLIAVRRPAVAAALSLVMITIIITLSQFKFNVLDMTLSFFDVLIIDADTIVFLLTIFPDLRAAVAVAAIAAIPLLVLIWRLDRFRLRMRTAIWGTVLSLAAMAALASMVPEQPWEPFSGVNHISNFARSGVLSVSELMSRGWLEADAAVTDHLKFSLSDACHPAGHPPHIIMVLDESSFDITAAPGIKVPPGYGDHFRSFDGKARSLLVEATGAAATRRSASIRPMAPSSAPAGFRPQRASIPSSISRRWERRATCSRIGSISTRHCGSSRASRCNGLFYRCSGGAEARRFNRLLIDAGLIKGL